MTTQDLRTRTKISLHPAAVLSSSVFRQLLPQLLACNAFLVVSLYAGKEWLLEYEVGVFWVLMRVLACGGLSALVYQVLSGNLSPKRPVEWSVVGLASLSLLVQQACLLTALLRTSPLRVLVFSYFASSWPKTLLNTSSSRRSLAVGLALTLALASEAKYSLTNIDRAIIPYGALCLHGLATMALEHTHGTLMLNLDYATTVSLTTLGASVVGLPMYVVRKVLHNPAPSPILPLKSLSVIPLLAGSFLLLKPKLAHSMSSLTSPRQPYLMAYFSVVFFAIITGTLLFLQPPGPMDFLVAAVLGYGLYPEGSRVAQAVPQTPTARIIRAYLKTILANSESRKIFYFLMLNMCYMLVQMLYGVWTNSLGLISDAIHMAFDCMAIAVGLMASVMATWPPNERFTYGYGRIETLSGFANGIFLILISIFIVFEAIERLLEPPEMNTSQLLLVSSLGLGVNLFGMFAMGGHHHGHSHSHGHSHGSSSGHAHSSPSESVEYHNTGHAHSHAHDEGHDHAHDHKPESPVISSSLHDGRLNLQGAREHDHSDSHSQEHSHWHSHSQPHSQEHSHSHSQVGDEHVHAHSPPGSTERNTPRSLHAAAHHKRRSFPGPALLIDGGSEGKPLSATHLSPAVAKSLSSATVVSPITPSYHFGHDEHYDTHHHDEHVPNLHDHSHVHDRHEGHSHNMRGVFLHVMADTLGSVGVIISTLLIQYYGWTGFDPIASLFIAVMIAASVIPLVIDTGKILCLDVGDRESDIQHALEELSSVHGLQSYSSVRFWPKDASSLIGSIHVQLSPSASNHDPTGPHSSTTTSYASVDRVVEKVDMLLRKRISGLEELSIQVEGHQRVSR